MRKTNSDQRNRLASVNSAVELLPNPRGLAPGYAPCAQPSVAVLFESRAADYLRSALRLGSGWVGLGRHSWWLSAAAARPKVVVAMPDEPSEFRSIMQRTVLPRVFNGHWPPALNEPTTLVRTYKTTDVPFTVVQAEMRKIVENGNARREEVLPAF